MKKIAIIGKKNFKKNINYYEAVTACGAEPIELDPYEEGFDTGALLKDADGLIIPGGVDLSPSLYNEENTDCVDMDPALDEYEMRTVALAVEKDLPILGICRGHQLLNVFFGGSLIQNISCCYCHKRVAHEDRVHCSRVEKGSFIHDIYGSEEICVNSAHHQAVKELGEGFVPVQFSQEKLVEAMYHRDHPIYSVQWHPERMCLKNKREDTVDGLKVFEFFIGKIC